ncbi:unnamed protein product [Acanthoscelides obtectus]|uniref:Uncharacterized protein n=1 Tax=Acanthoscelides obtectus TaxID=200917 RepID=A0A9P0LSI3_ACAOB|nr:unnamed protein product [Acanthoscelides obtectus]CAK1631040.1 Pupal cuticle protein [Acanthoscelides obtectus]
MQCTDSSSSTFTFSMKQLVLVLALFGAATAARLDNLQSQYLPPTGSDSTIARFGPQYRGTQYSQPQQPIVYGPTQQYSNQQGQYSSGIPVGQYYPNQQGQYSSGTETGPYYQGRYGGDQGQYSGATILKADNQPNAGDGTYSYSYETSNGISAQESGTGAVGAEGGYSYTSPEGEVISVRYTADADGFHPVGSHIPGVEAILKSIEINKAAAAQQYGAPSQQYGTPNQQYGTPNQQYGTPNQQYGTPAAGGQFGAGGQQQYQPYRTPVQQYNAPGPLYGTPSGISQQTFGGQQYSTPTQQYGAPSQYNRPSQRYGAPGQQYDASSSTFGARQGFNVPAPQYGTPNGSNQGYRY